MFDILFLSENSVSDKTDEICANVPIFSGFIVHCGKIVEVYIGIEMK